MLQLKCKLLFSLQFILWIHYVQGVLDDPCADDTECGDVTHSVCNIRGMCGCEHYYEKDAAGTGCVIACAVDELYCNNGNCVSLDVANNTFNDCGDNSDEGAYKICTVKSVFDKILGITTYVQRFKCTTGDTCTLMSFVNDGGPDCADKTDEFKAIGTTCNIAGDLFDCPVWMDDSECVANVDTPTTGQGTCQCRSGAYNNPDLLGCTVRILGDECTLDPDCEDAVNNSQCVGDLCVCDVGYIDMGVTICRPRLIYEPCTVDPDCSTLVANSHCDGVACLCDSGYKVESANDTCTIRVLGDECMLNPDCDNAVSNSECEDTGVCVCTYNYISNQDGTQCNYRKLNDPCVAKDHCELGVANSQCGDNGQCECIDGFFGDPDTLDRCTLRTIGDPCDDDQGCSIVIANGECRDGTCQCELGYYKTGDRTCVAREPGEPCDTDTDCAAIPGDAGCIDGVCDCVSGWMLVDGTCKKRTIGDTCDSDTDCGASVSNSKCEGGVCKCIINYSPSDNGKTCSSDRIDVIPCANDTMCPAMNSVCGEDGFCSCDEGYLLSSNGLVCQERGPRDPCESNTDCKFINPGGECINNKCQCSTGYVINDNNDGCDKFRAGNTTCSTDDKCLLASEHSECVDGICRCKDGFQASSDLSKCEAGKVGSLPCSDSAYCRQYLNNSECVNNTCQCASGYQATANQNGCDTVLVGSSCSNDETCHGAVSNSACVDNTCQCIDGYAPSEDNTECISTACTTFFCLYGWVLGVAIGLLLLIAIIIIIVICVRKKKRRGRAASPYKTRRGPKIPVMTVASRVPVMYKEPNTREPDDKDLAFNGIRSASSMSFMSTSDMSGVHWTMKGSSKVPVLYQDELNRESSDLYWDSDSGVGLYMRTDSALGESGSARTISKIPKIDT